jgi:DNA replication licensing factor MCM5
MSGFDDPGVYFSDPLFSDGGGSNEQQLNRTTSLKRFKDFIKTFMDHQNCFCYRDQLKRHYNLRKFWLNVDVHDLASFDSLIAEKLTKVPADYLPLFEEAAKEAADELTQPRPLGEEEVEDIQIMLKSNANPMLIRQLKSLHMAQLVKVPGIIINASAVKAKATHITIQCRNCRNYQSNIPIRPGLEGYTLPRKCTTSQAGQPSCSVDPYFIVPDKCKCVDFQTLKLQESPDSVPNGELPRHLQLYLDRYLTDRVVPGNRVTIIGIYSIKKGVIKTSKRSRDNAVSVGIRKPYIRVVGIEIDTEGPGRGSRVPMTPMEEEEMRQLAARPDVHEIIARSIAPSIYGGMGM